MAVGVIVPHSYEYRTNSSASYIQYEYRTLISSSYPAHILLVTLGRLL